MDDWAAVEMAESRGLPPPVFISISKTQGHVRTEMDIRTFQAIHDMLPFSLGRLWDRVSKWLLLLLLLLLLCCYNSSGYRACLDHNLSFPYYDQMSISCGKQRGSQVVRMR